MTLKKKDLSAAERSDFRAVLRVIHRDPAFAKRLFRAVGGDSRRIIASVLIRTGPVSVTRIAQELAAHLGRDVSLSRASHQLAVLQREGLVSVARKGRNAVYSLTAKP